MAWGRSQGRPVGASFGAVRDLEALFRDFDEEPDEEDEAFGPLRALHGWVGAAGPGVALAFPLRTGLHSAVDAIELRLREDGRYVRSTVRALRDRHGDVTLTIPIAPSREELRTHVVLPYAALPRRIGPDVVIEAWLVEDGEPVEEALWSLELPSWAERLLDNALGAVVLAAVSAASAVRGKPALVESREARIEAALGPLFALDAVGRAVAIELIRGVEPEGVVSLAARLRASVAPEAMARVLGLLQALSGGAPAERVFLERLAARLGVSRAEAPRARGPGRAGPLAVLGLAEGATWEEVRAAYRQAASVHHPDRAGPESHEQMKRINAAYAALRRMRR